MSDQVVPPSAEVDSAPPELVTATDSDTSTPEVAEVSDTAKPAEKVFTQAEVDEIISKRLARDQRKWEREQKARLAEMQTRPAVPESVPSVDQFETPEAYAEVLALKKAEELLKQREVAAQEFALQNAYHEREEDARTKYDDFEQVAYNPRLPITDVMAKTIQASDVGPDLAYWLGSNPKEAERISRLAPLLQAKEIGKIEARIGSDPAPVKKSSNAPTPISPVSSRSASIAYDTTDPRSTKTMTAEEWIKADQARMIQKLQAQRG